MLHNFPIHHFRKNEKLCDFDLHRLNFLMDSRNSQFNVYRSNANRHVKGKSSIHLYTCFSLQIKKREERRIDKKHAALECFTTQIEICCLRGETVKQRRTLFVCISFFVYCRVRLDLRDQFLLSDFFFFRSMINTTMRQYVHCIIRT